MFAARLPRRCHCQASIDVFDGDQAVSAITCVLPACCLEINAIGARRELSGIVRPTAAVEMSLPLPPLRRSLPLSPKRRSFPFSPLRVFAARLPGRCHCRPALTFSIEIRRSRHHLCFASVLSWINAIGARRELSGIAPTAAVDDVVTTAAVEAIITSIAKEAVISFSPLRVFAARLPGRCHCQSQH